ncbi:hypothetical protein [Paenibacillus glycanilyticus]|uniref:DUF4352 domain-containing protein n=1 Tax=Paenibacillus glycanilyticus TaxID=126569 RepID=A0ABQ6GIE3_9BACL|nr:hypothetical protein [Paenibacillus glycanilyticus]GLX70588.1 hypothetical protein MU1_49340 [Paenibacillus glycanilyticus]
MNKKMIAYALTAAILLGVASGCGNKSGEGATNGNTATETPAATTTPVVSESPAATESPTTPAEPAEESQAPDAAESDASGEILIIIDQTEKPIEGNSFDFVVNKIPEGYMLSKMEWKSDKTQIINTTQEAIEHGGNGEDGFYISGDGQFSGFFYPGKMKGEKGEVSFTFVNDAGKEISWKKSITLK